jgi:hypothetical protein
VSYTTAVRDACFGLLLLGFFSITPASELRAQSASTPTPTAVASRIAPPAVYYLTQWTSAKTQDSIRGYPPGTPLTVVGNFGDHLKVKAGDVEFEVKINQVTNDPQIATQASERDVRQQQQRSEAYQREIAQTAQSKKQQHQIKGKQNNFRDLEARYSELQDEEDDLLSQIGTAEQESQLSHATAEDKREQLYDRKDYRNDGLVAQLPLLESHLKDVQNEKKKVSSQLEQAQRSLQKQP